MHSSVSKTDPSCKLSTRTSLTKLFFLALIICALRLNGYALEYEADLKSVDLDEAPPCEYTYEPPIINEGNGDENTIADISKIPSKPEKPIYLSSGTTYDFQGRTFDGSNIKHDGLFRCWKKDKVTIMNVIVTGSPRYALLARNCTNATIKNFRMVDMLDSVGGIRFDIGGSSNGLTMQNVTGEGVGGHGIKIWNADGFKIDDITMNNTPSGCGLILGRCQNGEIGEVRGRLNNPTGRYATFRLANDNGPNITVKKVVSENSGRGVFILTGSYGVVIDSVDIRDARVDGVYIQSGTHTVIKEGKIQGNPNCRIRTDPGNRIDADCGGSIAR